MLTCYRQDRKSHESAGVRSHKRLEREGKSERTFGHLLPCCQESERSERSLWQYLLAISLRLLPDRRPLFNLSTSGVENSKVLCGYLQGPHWLSEESSTSRVISER